MIYKISRVFEGTHYSSYVKFLFVKLNLVCYFRLFCNYYIFTLLRYLDRHAYLNIVGPYQMLYNSLLRICVMCASGHVRTQTACS